jgi:hypothetical protein
MTPKAVREEKGDRLPLRDGLQAVIIESGSPNSHAVAKIKVSIGRDAHGGLLRYSEGFGHLGGSSLPR